MPVDPRDPPASPTREHVRQLARVAKAAGAQLARATGPDRRAILLALSDELGRPDVRARVLAANAEDLREAEQRRDLGELHPALVDRLALTHAKLDGLCDGLGQLADQADLVGRVELERELDDGLVLRRVSCPLGVVRSSGSRPRTPRKRCSLTVPPSRRWIASASITRRERFLPSGSVQRIWRTQPWTCTVRSMRTSLRATSITFAPTCTATTCERSLRSLPTARPGRARRWRSPSA